MKKLHREKGKRKMIRLGKVRYYLSFHTLLSLYIPVSIFQKHANSVSTAGAISPIPPRRRKRPKPLSLDNTLVLFLFSWHRYQVDHHGSYSIQSLVFFRNKYVCMTNNIHPLFSYFFPCFLPQRNNANALLFLPPVKSIWFFLVLADYGVSRQSFLGDKEASSTTWNLKLAPLKDVTFLNTRPRLRNHCGLSTTNSWTLWGSLCPHSWRSLAFVVL